MKIQAKNILSLFILLFLLTGFIAQVHAQQLPAFSIYRDHWNVINPASISNNYLVNEWYNSVGVSYRQHWWKAEGSPNTQVINAEFILPDYDNIITGGHIIRHQTGLIDQTGLYGQFAYRLEMGRRIEQALVFGLNAGIVQYRARLDKIRRSRNRWSAK